jgi:hypothetical protein
MESIADKIVEKIAKDCLNLEALEDRGSDDLDFHEHSVASIKNALIEAFDAGYRMCAEARG